MNSRVSLVGLIALSIALLLAGCSTAYLTSAWKQDGYTGKLDRVLVIGVADRETRRQIFESSIAKKLSTHGVHVVPSYTVFPGKEWDRQAVVDYAKQENLDSVIVTKVLDSEEYNQRVSYVTGGSSMRSPYYNRSYNGWYDDYRYSNQSVVTYDTKFVLTNLETNLYQLEGENMVWSVLVEVESTSDVSSDIEDLSNTLVKQLVADGLI